MFDGSFRTNKREINLAGKGSKSSSRRSNLNQAKQQRLARAQAKAKLNGAKCLQRSWRGSRGRKNIAVELKDYYQATVTGLIGDESCPAGLEEKKVVMAASILAFRMSPALLPFYATTASGAAGCNAEKKRRGAQDDLSEQCLRQDLLSLNKKLQICRGSGQSASMPAISPVASRRIVSITLVLLRQSIHKLHSQQKNQGDIQELANENTCLVQLVDCLLESSFTTVAETNASVGGWMINLFLCLRDCTFFYDMGGGASSMDADGSDKKELQSLLKWCCHTISHLAKQGQTQKQQQMQSSMQPLAYQQGLALLASILFSSSGVRDSQWLSEQLNDCIMKVEGHLNGGQPLAEKPAPSLWCPIMIHYLSVSMNALSQCPSDGGKVNNKSSRKVSGLIPDFSPNAQFTSEEKCGSTGKGETFVGNPWLEALRGTLASREFIVMNQVLSHADTVQNKTQEQKQLLTFAIPTILQYTLQNQGELAILTSFSAQGENIASWFIEDSNIDGSTGAALANAAVAAALNREDGEDDSDNDDDEQDVPAQQPGQLQQQQQPVRDNRTTSTGRQSRADLQTLPKLDALYQTRALHAKNATVNRLRSLLPTHGHHVSLLVSLADKIGKGEWIQQLGDTLFSSETSASLSSPLLAPLSMPSWQRQNQMAYTSALAAVMTTCSGIKAGRNAASPLLAKLAFHDAFLQGLWGRSSGSVTLLLSQSKSIDSTQLTVACEVFSSFCDTFSHHLLAVSDADFLNRYHNGTDMRGPIVANEVVMTLKRVLNDLYWIRPVLASDITLTQNDPESTIRFQRARLLLSGTKLWNSLYECWCRLYRVVQFCPEDYWWFPQLASRGAHDNNPIIQSQVTTLVDDENDAMDDSSVESAGMNDAAEQVAPMSANDAGGDALASTFRDPKMARVLTYIPQAMPFSRRVNLFNSLLESDKAHTQDESMTFRDMMRNLEDDEDDEIAGRERVTIRRDALYSDSKRRLNKLGKRLRKRVQITFVNKHGQEERGIDGGGVFKEFLDVLIKDAFLPEQVKEESGEEEEVIETHPDFFTVTPLQTLKVNTASDGNNAILSHYEFLGRVLGKAIYGEFMFETGVSIYHIITYVPTILSSLNRINPGGASVLSPVLEQAPWKAKLTG